MTDILTRARELIANDPPTLVAAAEYLRVIAGLVEEYEWLLLRFESGDINREQL